MLALHTKADSVAWQAYTFAGGPAWERVPYLRFEFAVEREGVRQPAARHTWNRQTGAYRLAVNAGPDSAFVYLFDVNTRDGQAFLNGELLSAEAAAPRLEEAYKRFINDTYWLTAPTKLFDPGVTRTFVPDSSTAEVDVIRLSFEGVGLTPEDQYWLAIERETGRLLRWTYALQGRGDRPPRTAAWVDYQTFETPAGPVTLATRHELQGTPVAILTDAIETPATLPPDLFTDPAPLP